ncbi:hypothetical protein [Glaciecola sp. 1036]|uniref:hypothetical protein n=1 Tax=Alteromonadaceae TaxID=72275 RepID=UPI003CFC22E1
MNNVVYCFVVLVFFLFSKFSSAGVGDLSQAQLTAIGEQIFRNETGGNDKYLVAWNDNEDFASLGIGHFIWFPEGLKSPFTETFPDLLLHMKSQGISLPEWLNDNADCPWSSKVEFMSEQAKIQKAELKSLLKSTFSIQLSFITKRMQAAFNKIAIQLRQDQSDLFKQRYNALLSSPEGIYSLVDYINFKGEGISPNERYENQGWGLQQVLLSMDDNTQQAFTKACKQVLTNRVNNSPQKEKELKWLPGWKKRCDTYSNKSFN